MNLFNLNPKSSTPTPASTPAPAGTPALAPSATPAPGTPAPAPSATPAPGQTSQPGTTPAPGTPATPATPGNPPAPAHPGQLQVPPTMDPNQPVDLAQLLAGQQAQSTPAADPMAQFAQQVVQNAMQGAAPGDIGTPGARINEEQLFQQMQQHDFMQGFDYTALETALSDGSSPREALTAFANHVSASMMHTMIPLMNAYGSAIQQQAITAAVSQSGQRSVSEQVVADFNNRFDYSSNPIVSSLLPGFVEQVGRMVKPGTPPSVQADAIDRLFRNLAPNVPASAQTPAQQPGSNQDFSELFGSRT